MKKIIYIYIVRKRYEKTLLICNSEKIQEYLFDFLELVNIIQICIQKFINFLMDGPTLKNQTWNEVVISILIEYIEIYYFKLISLI